MRDLFSQCRCVCTYMSVTLKNVNCHAQECQFAPTCMQRNSCITFTCTELIREDTGCLAQRWRPGREEWRFLTMEDGQDNTAGPPQPMCFAESSTERSRRLAALRKRKQQSQCTVEAKRARRSKRKCKRRKHAVESLHKPGINYAHFSCSIQPQSFLSSDLF